MGTIALVEKGFVEYKMGKYGSHKYFPLLNEKDLHEYKLILEKPQTIEDIVKATDSIASVTSKRLDELEARGLLYSKTIEEIGTKRYYTTGRDYSLLLRKD
jgi:predicted transcriptional regulator